LSAITDNRFSLEVVVVDNNSNDGMFNQFSRNYPDFIFVENEGNFGFGHGCNLGASKSTGQYLLFLNPDTLASAEAIFELLCEVKSRKPNSIISCLQQNKNGSFERPYKRFLSPATITGWTRAINRLIVGDEAKLVPQTDKYIYPDWVSGSVFMLSRSAYDDLSGWDDDYWMYFEDVDLCFRARQKGGEIVVLKSVVIEHLHGGTTRLNKKVTALTKTCVNISRHVYISKHEKGIRAGYMQSFLVVNNLIFGFFPAIAGVLLCFIGSLNVASRTYGRLAYYYLNALKTGTWISPRSVNQKSSKSSLSSTD
jgi:GT2 family glycosyltransferase